MELARRSDRALHSHKQRKTSSASVSEINLQERIRSLLLSRNTSCPPKTPCPTPDYLFLLHHPTHRTIGNYIAPPRGHSSLKLHQPGRQYPPHSLSEEMGATIFDGPTGHFQDVDRTLPRRSPSILYLDGTSKTGLVEGSPGQASSLFLSTPTKMVKSSQASKTTVTKSVSGLERPAHITYTLRTVAPKQNIRQAQRPDLQNKHVPGSYRSVGDQQTDINIPYNTSTAVSTDPAVEPKQVDDHDHHHGHHATAVDALHLIQDHLKPQGPHSRTHIPVVDNSGQMEVHSEPSSSQNLESSQGHDNQTPYLPPQGYGHDCDDNTTAIAADIAEGLSSNRPARGEDPSFTKSHRDQDLYTVPHDLPPLPDSPASFDTRLADTFVRQPSASEASVNSKAGQHPTSGGAHAVQALARPEAVGDVAEPDRQSTDEVSFDRKHQEHSDAFDRSLMDLEALLKQALDIADQTPVAKQEEKKEPLSSSQLLTSTHAVPHARDEASSASDSSASESDYQRSARLGLNPNYHHIIVEDYQGPVGYPDGPRTGSLGSHHIRAGSNHSHAHLSDRAIKLIENVNAVRAVKLPHLVVSSSVNSSKAEIHSGSTKDSDQASNRRSQIKAVGRRGESTQRSGLSETFSSRLPQIQPRSSSLRRKTRKSPRQAAHKPEPHMSSGETGSTSGPYVADFHNSALQYHPVYREAMVSEERPTLNRVNRRPHPPPDNDIGKSKEIEPEPASEAHPPSHPTRDEVRKGYSLKNRHHFEIHEPHGFSLSRSHRRSPIARDWNPGRKRFVATVTCINTALLGMIIGTYAGEVPAIQYILGDEHHYVILGNVVMYLGLALTTIVFWPLPVLHGRKPYTLGALILLMLLQFPQALAVASQRNPYTPTYRVGLLLPRALAGLVMGFANINFKTTLMDLFGASLQSGNPHQEVVNEHDVRRHGGGMGMWLGIWAWCFIGSIGVGFWVGASIISGLAVPWGFWITIIFNAAVLLLNVVTPEVRRSAYRRSMAEVREGTDVSRRIARGEIKMHLESTGPIHWWEEVSAGMTLVAQMLKQPGFAVLAFYWGWIYAQIVLIIVLLGALLSKYYHFHPQFVGLSVAIIPLGALLAMPFQKAGLFSRSRKRQQRTDSMTFEKRVSWTSHLVRRAIFMVALPFAGAAYTLASHGPPTHFMVPIIFAGLMGFLSNLAIAECNGLLMETFDTSDLQPGMTGRPRRDLPEAMQSKRTNFSCFPRVTAGFAIAQSFAFLLAAGATGWGGVVERHLGAQVATAVMAGVLLGLTILLIGVLTRYRVVQVVPSERFGTNILTGPEDEWKPVIIGNPSGTTRRVSRLELGTLSRWSEIRRRNKLGV